MRVVLHFDPVMMIKVFTDSEIQPEWIAAYICQENI